MVLKQQKMLELNVAFNGRNSTFQNLNKADLIIKEYNELNFPKIFDLFS